MPLWKLIPIDTHHERWALSTLGGPTIVRAETEQEARRLAAARYEGGLASRPPSSHDFSEVPWLDPALASIEQIEDDRWPADGPSEVVDDHALAMRRAMPL
jgi:hypothetical protein